MIFAIVAALLAYRAASGNGRNGWLWALAGAGVFLGTQVVVTVAAGFFVGIGIEFFGWSESLLDNSMFFGPVAVAALGASILTTWLLLRYLNKPVDEEPVNSPQPPPPPTFGNPR